MRRFLDRSDAGRFLAARLMCYAGRPDVLVLALPRGGVPVGYEVARALDAPLDVFIVRKLGVPGHEELAMGAIASGGVRVLNSELIERLGLSREAVDAVAAREALELERRERLYRDRHEPRSLDGRTLVLVDDGLATGSTMRAAAIAARKLNPLKIVVAVPVAAPEVCEEFRAEVDEIVCAYTPDPFDAVGLWYEDFTQVEDAEVRKLLAAARHDWDAIERTHPHS
jgi:predicted phosphoribosyltransferase